MTSPSNLQSGIERPIERETYYHGLLPREDVRNMLRNNGDFLIRMSEPKPGEARVNILSVMHNNQLDEQTATKHFVINMGGGKCYIEKVSFDTIQAMIEYYMNGKIPIRENIVIVNPIHRLKWELDHQSIAIKKKLGEGAFGEVCMGEYKMKNGKTVQVAVKQAKLEKATKEQIKEFMSEARVMREFLHPNVVRFYGVAAGQEPLYMVLELATNGSLDGYLKKNPDLPVAKLDEMILQAAWGLEYVHQQGVLHRDIAARNCLYGGGNVKIADFGLSRKCTSYQMDPTKRVPIRWLAIETLRTQMYTQKTDVWSYGIMAWEIYNYGIEPYPGMTVAEVNQKVREGYRMDIPPSVSPAIASLLTNKCWAENPNDRLLMNEIAASLQRITNIQKPNFATFAAEQATETAGPSKTTTKKGKKKGGKAPKGMRKGDE